MQAAGLRAAGQCLAAVGPEWALLVAGCREEIVVAGYCQTLKFTLSLISSS